MTNEKAKEIMKRWYLNGTEGMTDERLGYIEGWFNKEDKLAFELAIKALEAQTVPQITVFTETADEKAVADLKAELQSVLEKEHLFVIGVPSAENLIIKENTDVYSINNMSVSDIIHWCATHPDPEIKKQFEEELVKYNKLKEITNDRTETDPHH